MGVLVGWLVWFGLVWFGLVWFGLVWFGWVWLGLVWLGLVGFGWVWFGWVWLGWVGFGLLFFRLDFTISSCPGTHYIKKAVLGLLEILLPVSWVLVLKVCPTTPGSTFGSYVSERKTFRSNIQSLSLGPVRRLSR